jgi:hypothetical protein
VGNPDVEAKRLGVQPKGSDKDEGRTFGPHIAPVQISKMIVDSQDLNLDEAHLDTPSTGNQSSNSKFGSPPRRLVTEWSLDELEDVDDDISNPQMACIYAQDIFAYLRGSEVSTPDQDLNHA